MIFDLSAPFVQAPELQRSEVYVPQPVADFLEPDVFAGEGVRDADPALPPLLRLTSRTSKCPGYSRGASCGGNSRPDGR